MNKFNCAFYLIYYIDQYILRMKHIWLIALFWWWQPRIVSRPVTFYLARWKMLSKAVGNVIYPLSTYCTYMPLWFFPYGSMRKLFTTRSKAFYLNCEILYYNYSTSIIMMFPASNKCTFLLLISRNSGGRGADMSLTKGIVVKRRET